MRAILFSMLALGSIASTASAEPVALKTLELDSITAGQVTTDVSATALATGGPVQFASTGAITSAEQTQNYEATSGATYAVASGENRDTTVQVSNQGNIFFERTFYHQANTRYSSYEIAAGVAVGK